MGLFSRKDKKTKVADEQPAPKPVSVSTGPQSQDKKIGEDKTRISGSAHRLLLRPMISEKSTIGVALNKYVFEVPAGANKVEIKKAIEESYGVKPRVVNIINVRSKKVRFGRYSGRTKAVKKALVTLKKGDSIKLYEGI